MLTRHVEPQRSSTTEDSTRDMSYHSGRPHIAPFPKCTHRTGRDRAPLHSDGPKGGEYSQKKSTLLGDLIDLVRRIAGDLLRLGGGAHAGQRSVLAITAHAVGAGLEAFRHIDVAPLTRTKAIARRWVLDVRCSGSPEG